jgi:hypothetical protein
MNVTDIFQHIRDGLGTSGNSRWSDAELLRQINLALNRAQGILQRNAVSFGRKKHAFTATAGVQAYDLPGDFAAVVGLWRSDTHRPLTHFSQEGWEGIMSAVEASVFAVDDEQLLIAGTPAGPVPFVFRYWPTAPTVTAASAMPWSGKLDYIVIDYVRARLFNTDEMDVSQDTQFLQDLENNIVAQFTGAEPSVRSRRGWLL